MIIHCQQWPQSTLNYIKKELFAFYLVLFMFLIQFISSQIFCNGSEFGFQRKHFYLFNCGCCRQLQWWATIMWNDSGDLSLCLKKEELVIFLSFWHTLEAGALLQRSLAWRQGAPWKDHQPATEPHKDNRARSHLEPVNLICIIWNVLSEETVHMEKPHARGEHAHSERPQPSFIHACCRSVLLLRCAAQLFSCPASSASKVFKFNKL